jgi:glycerate-2-kinase
MSAALADHLGPWLQGGLVITPVRSESSIAKVEQVTGSHPLPSEANILATEMLLEQVADIPQDHLVWFVLTGGASSLLCKPAEGLSLAMLRATSTTLMRAGANIQQLNTVRKHLSQVKGGWLAGHLYPRTTCVLAISDVPRDDLEILGSGPCYPDRSTFEDALNVIDTLGVAQDIPREVRDHLERGRGEPQLETPSPHSPWFRPIHHQVVANLSAAAESAQRRARHLGYDTEVVTLRVEGEARHIGATLGARARQHAQQSDRSRCLLFGGEATVRVTGRGRGGRNQEIALAAAREIAGLDNATVFSLGTDGVDGPTDAAGAIVDGCTWQRILDSGTDPAAALRDNDSYSALDCADALVRSGPTKTNVTDLMGIVVTPA